MMLKSEVSAPMRLLLDKSVVRRYIEAVSSLARGEVLSVEEHQVVLLVHQAPGQGNQLTISLETYNLVGSCR